MRYLPWIGIGLVVTVALGFGWVAFENYGPPPSLEDIRRDPCGIVFQRIGHGQTLDVCAMDGEALDVRAERMRVRTVTSYVFGKQVVRRAREFTVEILGRARSPVVPVGARTQVFSFERLCPDDPDITLQQGHQYLVIGRWDDDIGAFELRWEVQSVFEVHDGRLAPLVYTLMDLDVEGHTPAAFLDRVRRQCIEYDLHPMRRKFEEPKVVLH
jgi:hypothetical protein